MDTSKIGSLVDVQSSKDPEGIRIFYYLVQVRFLLPYVLLVDSHFLLPGSPQFCKLLLPCSALYAASILLVHQIILHSSVLGSVIISAKLPCMVMLILVKSNMVLSYIFRSGNQLNLGTKQCMISKHYIAL
ncbi:hypothetical protein SAY86_008033 [Trapa natans]|uniref:Uncharacterized protein n=1 Tax=Trapa natans TaxID=22666 RepID=A0AAN7LG46_TRANT|nr:hypothetical protein SAY86_008033 [Trapa natans]